MAQVENDLQALMLQAAVTEAAASREPRNRAARGERCARLVGKDAEGLPHARIKIYL